MTMTKEHKDQLAVGREQGRIVRRYLDALDSYRPRRGRPINPDSLREQISKVEAALETATALERLTLIQKRIDLQARLDGMEQEADADELEEAQAAFIDVAFDFSERKSVSREAWREVGVPASVLRAAGL